MISASALPSNYWSNAASAPSATAGGTAFPAPPTPAPGTAVAAPSQTQLASRLQALLLQLQSDGAAAGPATAHGPAGTATSSAVADSAEPTQTASLEPEQAASGTQGRHHHHHHGGETQQDGGPPTASTATTSTASATGGTADGSAQTPAQVWAGAMAQALQSYASNGSWSAGPQSGTIS